MSTVDVPPAVAVCDPEPPNVAVAGSPRSRFSLLRLLGGSHLLRTGHLLTLSSTATSVIGLLYWAVATRLYGAAAVGRSYAAVSALSFLAGIGQLDLGNVLIRFVPTAGARLRRLVLGSYAVAALGALVAATLFVLIAPSFLPGLAFLRNPALGSALVAGAVAYAVFVLQDSVLTGLRRPGWLLTENTVFALVKVVLLFALAGTALRTQGILLSWIAALIAAVLITNGLMFARVIRRDRPQPDSTARPAVAPGIRYIAADYTGELFWMAAMSLPPIMVLSLLGPEQSAYYALAWMIAHALYMVSINMGSSLVVELAREPGRTGVLRHMFKHTGLLLAGCTAVVAVGAPLILRLFGAHYAHQGTGLLRLMAVSALPVLVIVTAVSVARAQRRMKLVVTVYATLCVLVLGLAGVLMRIMGVEGVGVAWLAGTTAVAATLLSRSSVWTASTRQLAPSGPEIEAAPPPAAVDHLTLSVVVCAYTLDRWDDLDAAIASLHQQARTPDEIILVVDHCEALAARARGGFGGIRVIENAEQRGLSGARNTGVRAAHGDVVAFLDDDAVADRRWAEHLLAPYGDSDVLGVGGHVDPNWEHGRPSWFPREFDWVVGCTYRGMRTQEGRVRNFIGANMSFRRALLDRLGGFRHDLGRVGTRPLGGEETELCIRAARLHRDGRMVHAPAAIVRHHVTAQRSTWAYFRARCYAEGLSKAAVRRFAGTDAALASERGYLTSTIPAALLRPLRTGAERTRWITAVALLTGVAWTIAGYCVGRTGILAGEARRAASGPAVSGNANGAATTGALTTGTASGETASVDAAASGAGPVGTAMTAARTRTASRLTVAVSRAALPGALGLWLFSLRRIRLSAISDLGLITALPVTFWIGLGLLAVGFAATVHGRSRFSGALAAGYVLGLIAMLHATPALTYPTLRYAWAWKHVAVVDLMSAHGSVAALPSSDPMSAYSQWPGFFALNSLISQLTGASSAGSYAAWAPPFFNVLMLVPLLLLYRSVTARRRLVWTGVWLFYVCSWVGQDYFAPQAYAFVLYLLFLAVLMRRLRHLGRPGSRVPAAELALLLLIAAAVDTSHQLTPVMSIIAVAALALRRGYRRALLPLLAGTVVLAAAWDATVAGPFMAANAHSLVHAVGALDSNVGSGLVGLGSVDPDQVLIAWIDRALTAFVFALALVGLILRRRLRRSPIAALALCPLVLGGASNYGGEMIFRVYLFALPGLALLAAAALTAPDRGPRARSGLRTLIRPAVRGGVVATVSAALLGGLVFGYYGKERANYFTPDEVAAARYLAGHASAGDLILAPNDDFPGAYIDYPQHPHLWFAEQNPDIARLVLADPVGELSTLSAGSPDATSYVILTDSQAAAAGQSGSLPSDGIARIRAALEGSPASTVVYRSANAEIFRLSLAASAVPEPESVGSMP